MRTTLDIDEDLHTASKDLALHEGGTAGQVVPRPLRRSMTVAPTPVPSMTLRAKAVAGFEPFPAKTGVVVTNDQVYAMRNEEGL